METVLVQLHNNKAYKLLEDLEDMQILKVLRKGITGKQKASETLARKEKPVEETADDLQILLAISEKSLSKDWLTTKEDEVWKDL